MEKKISATQFEKTMNDSYTETETFDWMGNEVVVTKTLSLGDMMQFVSNVVSGCFNSETGEYMPDVREFLVRHNTLEMYANFELPDDANVAYKLVYCTDVAEQVRDRINNAQMSEIRGAIDARIRNILMTNTSVIARKMDDMVTAFTTLQKQTEELFSGITGDDVKNVVGAIGDGTLNPEEIVRAYMTAGKEDSNE